MSDKHEQLTSGGESRTEAGSADWQRYLDAELGLRNHWYPAFFSRDLADGETRHESLLGERIYFKRVAGRVYAVENRCAHRGAPFSSRVECYTDERSPVRCTGLPTMCATANWSRSCLLTTAP